jgi:hypothetical protein
MAAQASHSEAFRFNHDTSPGSKQFPDPFEKGDRISADTDVAVE